MRSEVEAWGHWPVAAAAFECFGVKTVATAPPLELVSTVNFHMSSLIVGELSCAGFKKSPHRFSLIVGKLS